MWKASTNRKGGIYVRTCHLCPSLLLVLTLSLTMCPSVEAQGCAGDCDADDTVSVGDLVTGVVILLGLRAADDCLLLDANADGRVAVDEVVAAVNNNLLGCDQPVQFDQHEISLSAGKHYAVVEDVDKDGLSDIVTSVGDIVYGQGNRRFLASTYTNEPEDNRAQPFAVLDVDGDGLTDIAHSGAISYGIGSRAFEAPQELPGSYAAGDLDQDTIVDLAAPSQMGVANNITVSYGEGQRSFEDGVGVFSYGNKRHLAVTLIDIDADGLLDIVSPLRAPLANNSHGVGILYGGGGRAFSTQQFLRVGRLSRIGLHVDGPLDLVVFDLDADGLLDIVTANEESVSVLYGLGDRTHTTPVRLASVSPVRRVAVGDVDCDGRADILTLGEHVAAGVGSVRFGRSGRTFAIEDEFSVGGYPSSISAVDIDGDDCAEIVIGQLDSVVVLFAR